MDKIYGIIYKIKNKENNKYYIGQTTSDMGFKGRYRYSGEGIERVYKHNLKQKEKGNSYNNYLLFSIEKYGFEAFEVDEEFDIAYSKEELDELEIKYIKEFNCIIPNGYNISYGGSSGKHSETTKQKLREINLGKHHTEESKKKMSESRKGRVFSEEHRRRLSEAEKGEKNHNYGKHLSEETKQKIREAVSGENNPMYGKTGEQHPVYGLKHTEESKKKLSKSLKGKYTGEKAYWYGKERDEETKQKISEAKKGKTLSEEHKSNISKSLKGKYIGERNPNYGKKASEETREKLSRINKLKWEDEEYRQMMIKKQSGENNYWYGKQLSEEHKKKLSEAKKGKYKRSDSPHAKAVYCYELNEIRLCVKEWADELKLSNAHISSCCTGKRKSTGGYHFRYATEEEIEEYKKNKGLI